MAQPRTKPGTPKLSELARKVVAPEGITATGWPAVAATCSAKMGIEFDPWQHGAGRLILAKRGDRLASMIGGVGMSLPRQVGKTYLIGGMTFALCLNRKGMLVIWSAHHARTHGETFLAMQGFADRTKVKPYVRQVYTGSGDEAIVFRNGSRILFGARERGFGRGIPGVDMIVSDEAQIMSDKALDAQLATMNTSQFGLAVNIGTPPRPEDPSEAFTRMRTEAWSGTLRDSAWIEFGADKDARPDDRKAWARANPSYPTRTPVESMLRLQRRLKPDSFLREGLGVWDEGEGGGALSWSTWRGLADAKAERGETVVFGMDVAEDRSAWLAVAWRREDGRVQVQLVDDEPRPAYDITARAAEVSQRWAGPVVPPRAFEDELDRAAVQVQRMPLTDFPAACGVLADLVTSGQVAHGNQAALNTAVKAAKWRASGTTAERAFLLKDCPQVGPLVAATRAVYGLQSVGAGFNIW